MRWSAALWLIRDTFRQAWSSRLSQLILAMTGLCILLCLSLRIDAGPPLKPEGEIELIGADGQPLTSPDQRPGGFELAFGGIRVGMFRSPEEQVHFFQVILAKWVAGAAGTLLAVVWAAGFLPEFLHPATASVLLAKPISRWKLLIGKYLGILVFVSTQAAIFVFGTWAALAVRTGVVSPGYLLCLPLLILHFAVIQAASTLLAVCTRNANAAAFGTIIFWFFCFTMNRGRHLAVTSGHLEGFSPFRWAVELGYWCLPKPADFVMILDQLLRIHVHFRSLPELTLIQSSGVFLPTWSIVTSVIFAGVLLAIAMYEFEELDY